MTTTPDRRPTLRGALAAACLAGAALLAAPAPGRAAAAEVIVRAPGAGASSAAAAVASVGGEVAMSLPIVDGVAATVPEGAVARLRARGLDVSANQPVTVHSTGTGSSNPSNIKSVFLQEIGADKLHAAGIDGDGATVALIDTGVDSVPDLAGRIVPVTSPRDASPQPCLNLSGEPGCGDTFGHGTFMATLIAGNGAASGGLYKGVAPKARIVSLKIAGADGSSDVSKVLAAIQFAVQSREQYGIKVLNLSLGTDSRQSPQTDPLNMAVQRAWDSGITTVVAAGNRGPGYDTVTKPGDDPVVITVGATDDRETPAVDDDRVPLFSGRGSAERGIAKPDVAAPGTKLIGVLPKGSTIANGLSTPPVIYDYRRASGTSMAAAVVSGSAALLAEARPSWQPGQVKTALTTTARKVALSDPLVVGAGLVDVHGASLLLSPVDANLGVARSAGTGSLEASRGTLKVVATCYDKTQEQLDPNCNKEIEGEVAANGRPYDAAFAGTSWYGTSWYGTSWYGTSWYGTSWYGTSWYSTEASQGSAGDGNAETESVHGAAPPGSTLYGLWR